MKIEEKRKEKNEVQLYNSAVLLLFLSYNSLSKITQSLTSSPTVLFENYAHGSFLNCCLANAMSTCGQ